MRPCPMECGNVVRATASPDYVMCPKCGPIRMRMPTFDQAQSEQARDEALASVTREGFSSRVRMFVADNVRIGKRFTGEDVRRWCHSAGIQPHHPNAWGGVIAGLVRSGLIAPTGERRKMTDVRSHARKTDVYKRVE